MEKVDLKMRKIVFFDGVCHLCNGFVDAIISRDKTHRLLFAPLQGSTAAELLNKEDRIDLDTVVYFEAGKNYYRSSAVLKILIQLGGAYKLLSIAWIIPAPIRDFFYKKIAKNRYAWFGEREFCRLPTPAEKDFLLP